MKRKGGKVNEQPVVKKPEVNVSTDFRSKIGAKLQTLLNGITSDSDLFIRSRRELYADLFREPQYPEIVIDPTIVVKIEDTDSEQSSDAVSQVPSENFLSSAKSRITELLNKRPDSEKENSLSSSECIPASSSKSRTSQSLSSSASKGRVKNSSNPESLNASHSDVLISQGQLQNACVIVEDIMKSKTQTDFTHLTSDQSKKNQTSTSCQMPCPKSLLSKRGRVNNKNYEIVTSDKTVSSSEFYTDADVCIIDAEDVTKSKSQIVPSTSNTNSNYSSILTSPASICNVPPNMLSGDTLIQNNSKISSQDIHNEDDTENIDDPEMIGDPEVIFSVGDSIVPDTSRETIPDNDGHEPDVIVLCEKRPTYEVITLEEDNDIIEEVQKCVQCGKTFRAKSLLNFHLRMHGSDLVSQDSSSSA